jgi:hypothetical protein
MWFMADLNAKRRFIDSAGLAGFHFAAVALFAWSVADMVQVMNLVVLAVLAMDVLFYLYPVKRKVILDPKSPPPQPADPDSFIPEHLMLLGPPTLLVCWFLALVWSHRTLTHGELIAVVVGLPIVVGLVSWGIYLRMTRYHIGMKSNKTNFVGITMLATWVLSTFFFVVLLVWLLVSTSKRS